uniref:phosphoinositide phospholipase C n=1 Tax=viral metagenome TaxID=1070528 RepID=A0A6C0EXW4_9ZZZZ
MNSNTKNSNSNSNSNSKSTSNNNSGSTSSSTTSSLVSTSIATVDSIIKKVKESANSNLRVYLIIVIPIIIFLVYILYKYNLGSRTANVISNMTYSSNISLEPIPQCYQTDIKQQYKLCDYYISSSFMTPCVGNQQYDYVSNDMISKVIQSGARYIQIPICELDVSSQAIPVVGTAEYGQRIITSLNTLDIKATLKTIRGNAFKVNNKKINYPLIVHLILNTKNPYTLSVLADNINEVLNDVLIDASHYKTFPLFLEKLCNLSGKIILFATPEYIGTKLEPYIVPTNKLFEIYHFSELGPLVLSSDTIYTNSYNQRLSTKGQSQSNKLFKQKYPSMDYIVSNADTIGNTILNDNDILNNLTCFNKVGVTIVKPNYPADVISKNYDPSESIYYGCQFITMNFQINDDNMKNYIDIFKQSSFRLKPASMRFSETEEPTRDLLSVYESILQVNDNIISDFYYTYNNLLLSFEAYSLPNTYLTQIEQNLRFNLGSKQIRDKVGNVKYKLNVNQCFIPRKSNIGSSDNISINLESAAMPGYFITMSGNGFILQNLANSNKDLMKQSFYIEKPKTADNENGQQGKLFSIRTTDNDQPMFIAFDNKQVKAYADTPQVQAHNNMTFAVNSVKFNVILNIITIFNGILKTMGGNIIGALENNTLDGTNYIALPASTNSSGNGGNNFNILNDQFILKNKDNKTYVINDTETGFLYDKALQPNPNGIFSLKLNNGYYNILNSSGQEMILFNKNLIKFVDQSAIVSNENLFNINITYEIL